MGEIFKKTSLVFILSVIISIEVYSQFTRKPTWRDEFKKNGIVDKSIWTPSKTQPSERQLSGYCDSDSNIYVKDGCLHLRLFKSLDTIKPYKAGRIIANKEYRFNKGKIVIRAKAPLSKGVWPAIWFSGPNTTNGYHIELDLMEHIYAMGDSSYTAVYHIWGDFRRKEKNHVSYGQKVPINVGEWHVYTLEITDDRIVMKVDGVIYYDIQKGMFGDEWPTDQEFSLRLAMAYGGYGAKKYGIDDSALPAEMLVDYVRFYKIKD